MSDPSEEQADGQDEDIIYHPDLKDDKDGLYCFLNEDRGCGPDCMAYLTTEPDSPQLEAQQKRCLLLVSIERLPRFLGGGVALFKKEHEARRAERGDRQRKGHDKPPDPMGKQ